MNKQTHRIEGDVIELEFGGGPGDLTTGHEAIVQHDGVIVEFMEPLAWNDETVHQQAWPFIATVANMVDPGTFGSQYLFAAVERHLSEGAR